jgi:hypothetical protein
MSPSSRRVTNPRAAADTPVVTVSRAWLYVRGRESVRIVIDGTGVSVYGPGTHFSHSQFREEMDATLHHAALEEALVLEGFTLERLTTERRSGTDRRASTRGRDRRRPTLRLVRNPGQEPST